MTLHRHSGDESLPNDEVLTDEDDAARWAEAAADWACPNCGSDDPHHALAFPRPDDERFRPLGVEPDPEVEVDVTCQSVYVTPVDGGDGFGFTHDEFERIIEHYREVRP